MIAKAKWADVPVTEPAMQPFRRYRRKGFAEMRPFEPGESLTGVSISDVDHENGSPKPGDMVARNPDNPADLWLVAKAYFEENFEEVEPSEPLFDKDGDMVMTLRRPK